MFYGSKIQGNSKDLFRIRRLFYPKIFNLPGSLEINGTFLINRQLPKDWNLSADISIKSRLGWISIPCDGWYFIIMFLSKFIQLITTKIIAK